MTVESGGPSRGLDYYLCCRCCCGDGEGPTNERTRLVTNANGSAPPPLTHAVEQQIMGPDAAHSVNRDQGGYKSPSAPGTPDSAFGEQAYTGAVGTPSPVKKPGGPSNVSPDQYV